MKKKVAIASEDFIGSVYNLEYLVRDCLGRGKKYGKICLKHVYGTLEFQITASADGAYELNMNGLIRDGDVPRSGNEPAPDGIPGVGKGRTRQNLGDC